MMVLLSTTENYDYYDKTSLPFGYIMDPVLFASDWIQMKHRLLWTIHGFLSSTQLCWSVTTVALFLNVKAWTGYEA